MSNFNPKEAHGSMEMWLVTTAIGKNHKLIDEMQKNEDGSYPVIFSVGGVELDFHRVAERIEQEVDRIENSINERAMEKAKELLNEKYDGLIEEIMEIQEKIETQKEKFKYDWE